MLEIEGINDTTTYETKLYKIPIKDKNNQTHILDCYGLDKISSEVELPDENSYANLCHKLGVHPEEVRRPKKIDLLISQREAHLMSDDVKSQVNKIKLYDGPLGQTISGTDPDLKFPRYNTCYPTVARQVFLRVQFMFIILIARYYNRTLPQGYIQRDELRLDTILKVK